MRMVALSSGAIPAERRGQAANGPLVDARRQIAASVTAGIWASEPRPVSIKLNGVSALRFDPPVRPVLTIVHFHGGAYRLGCPDYVGPFAAALAIRCNATVICPRYRLAPEHPFPAALNDGLAILRADIDPAYPLFVSGDSAGGGLAASLTAVRIADGAPPAGLILLSAWLDLRVEGDCYRTNAASDPLISRESAREAADLYLQGLSATNALASPLLGEVADFPPTFINYGLGEVLAEDSRSFAAALRSAGVIVRSEGIAGMDHVAVTRSLELPGAMATFSALCDFVDEVISRLHEQLTAWNRSHGKR